MDDEAPLACLAGTVSKPSYDDDTPLAALASSNKPRVHKSIGKPSGLRQNVPPGVKGKGKAKGKGKGSSGSSSGSSSSSSSSDSDGEKGEKRRQGKALKKKLKAADDGLVPDEQMKRAKDKRNTKEKLIADILSRWWYGPLTDWPPKDDEYYKAELMKRHMRQVDITNWEWEDDVDDKGFRKCYGLAQFYGVFRDSLGVLHDLRPKDTCPCYENYMKKDLPELQSLLVACLEGQLEALKKSVYDETKLSAEIMSKLAKVRDFRTKTVGLTGKKTVLPSR